MKANIYVGRDVVSNYIQDELERAHDELIDAEDDLTKANSATIKLANHDQAVFAHERNIAKIKESIQKLNLMATMLAAVAAEGEGVGIEFDLP